jgi:NAD(P)-dependent dehydrogenase (short-subunit alcohol dehydrogenase family)
MQVKDKVIIVTGGASGIGAALCSAFLGAGASAVVAADLRLDGAPAGTDAQRCDVSVEADIIALVAYTEQRYGRVDIAFSNAGVLTAGWDVREANFAIWERDWRINVLAHAMMAKAVLPGMMARGNGALLSTASAAGLLATPEALAYTLTKHAAVALAEQLAFSYRRFGIYVSVLCPMAVDTPMVDALLVDDGASAGLDGVLTSDAVAAATLEGMANEQFFIFPHPTVPGYWSKKAAHHDRWLNAMATLQAKYTDAGK